MLCYHAMNRHRSGSFYYYYYGQSTRFAHRDQGLTLTGIITVAEFREPNGKTCRRVNQKQATLWKSSSGHGSNSLSLSMHLQSHGTITINAALSAILHQYYWRCWQKEQIGISNSNYKLSASQYYIQYHFCFYLYYWWCWHEQVRTSNSNLKLSAPLSFFEFICMSMSSTIFV